MQRVRAEDVFTLLDEQLDNGSDGTHVLRLLNEAEGRRDADRQVVGVHFVVQVVLGDVVEKTDDIPHDDDVDRWQTGEKSAHM